MRYLHTMVRISNIEESLEFYCEKLGMEEVRRHESEAGKYTNIFLAASADTKSATEHNTPLLELTYNWPREDGSIEEYPEGRNFGHLAYAVENIYETCAKLMEAGVVINRPPREGKMAFIKSPDGVSIELLQFGDPLPQQEPWLSAPNVETW